MKLIAIFLLGLLLPASVLSQINCHRCFGNSYCNDANHPDFLGNVWNATCPSPTTRNDDDDPFLTEVEKVIQRNIRQQFDDQATLYNTTVQHLCLTATVHEAHDNHTLRTCITRNINNNPNQTSPSLCELIGTVIAPANYYNGTFSCRTCNSHFCNTHSLRTGDGTSGANIATLSLFVTIAVMLLHF